MTLNNKIMAMSALGLVAITILSGCGGEQQPVQQPVQYAPQAPVIVNQPAPAPVQQQAAPVVVQQDSGVGTALAAGAIGYMVGSAGSRQPSYQPPAQHTTVVHKTTVINKAPARVKPWYAPARTKSNYTTTTRTTTRTTRSGRR